MLQRNLQRKIVYVISQRDILEGLYNKVFFVKVSWKIILQRKLTKKKLNINESNKKTVSQGYLPSDIAFPLICIS